jgi:DNA invertase Pin-like site-specific DNA recombinase
MKTAFVYLRVSGPSQLEGTDGFPRQLKACKAYAAANGIKVVKVFQERAVSGTREQGNRPAFDAMLLALYSNGTRTVIIERLDRLARRLTIQESIIADFQRHGLELLSTLEPDLDSKEPERVMFRQVMGAFNEYEKSKIVLRLRGARQRKRARDGRCEGRKPYGYRAGEELILKRMQELRGQGTAFDAVAATLNAEGLKTRSGKLWYGATINNILRSQAA